MQEEGSILKGIFTANNVISDPGCYDKKHLLPETRL